LVQTFLERYLKPQGPGSGIGIGGIIGKGPGVGPGIIGIIGFGIGPGPGVGNGVTIIRYI